MDVVISWIDNGCSASCNNAAPVAERVLKLDRLDAQRLAVLVSRGADDDYSVYDGVLEFDVSPGLTGRDRMVRPHLTLPKQTLITPPAESPPQPSTRTPSR